MKRTRFTVLTIICILSLTVTSFGAAAAQTDTAGRQYSFSTAALNTYNYAQVDLSGSEVRIFRRGEADPRQPDQIDLRMGGVIVRSQFAEWNEQPVEGAYYGYTAVLDMAALGDGEYALTIETSAIQWQDHATGETSAIRSPYTLTTVSFVKEGSQCYFPADTRISARYNNALLQQLRQGGAPDDFTVLKEQYGGQDNSNVLPRIEAKSKELTAGLTGDFEKCVVIQRWISENIAYDHDFPRKDIDAWLAAHPEDAPRMEDPLYAFENGYAQCYGYAKLTTLMLGYAGIDSVYIRGRSETNVSNTLNRAEIAGSYSESWNTRIPDDWFYRGADGTEMADIYNHAWNAVQISGSWYFLDTCKNATYGYYRANSLDSSTGYLQLKKCYSGAFVFPTLTQISDTHIAIRYGAEGYGKKL